jgi:uncharacterized Zn finger protein
MARKRSSSPGKHQTKADRLRNYLQSRPAGELVELLLRFALEHDAIGEQLDELITLQTADVDSLVKQARREIRERTSEEIDSRTWGPTGGVLPDFSKLRGRFEALFRAGQYEVLVDLGRELFDNAQGQIEESRGDEGQTSAAIRECLAIAYDALIESSRRPVDKVLWAIDMRNDDGFDLSKGVEKVLERAGPAEVWSAVADALAARLRGRQKLDSRDRRTLVDDLAGALDRAGRADEVLPLFETEAPVTGDYGRLVKRLIAAGRLDDAERWALEGIQRIDHYEGVQLRDLLRDLARKRRDWPRVAAFQAEMFFEGPSVRTFLELMKAAQRASCEQAVRWAALHFLQTGEKPPAREWPLPEVPGPKPDPYRTRSPRESGPHIRMLIELAIVEQRFDDVLRWYDRLRQEEGDSWGTLSHYRELVAKAVADTHPEQALGLYRELVDARIGSSNYEAAEPYLERVRDLLIAAGRQADWTSYLAELRAAHRRRRRLMDVLDRVLAGTPGRS